MTAKILLIDDDEAVLASLGAVLTSKGYEVVFAKNGREAIEQFRESLPDLALLDLNMPVKGGWDAFEQLTGYNPLMPVILITARPDQYPLAVAAGVAALMEKPLDIPLLLTTIRQLLEEPPEARLSRMTGKAPVTRYLPHDQSFEFARTAVLAAEHGTENAFSSQSTRADLDKLGGAIAPRDVSRGVRCD